MTIATLLGALGLLIAAEGLLYALFPATVRRALSVLLGGEDDRLRLAGLAAVAAGAALAGLGLLLR